MKRTRSFFTVLAVLAMTVGAQPAFATHFDNTAATGSFDPQYTVTFGGTPKVNRVGDLSIRMTQVDHEDPVVYAELPIPGQWQFPMTTLRPGEKPDSTATTECDDVVDGDRDDTLGNQTVARAEKIGIAGAQIAASGLGRPPPPIVYDGSLLFLSWDAANSRARLCFAVQTDDSRLATAPLPPEVPAEDVAELRLDFWLPLTVNATGDPVWAAPIDLKSLIKDQAVQALDVSILEVKLSVFGHSIGNWHSGGLDTSKAPATSGTYNFAGYFQTCPANDPAYNLCKSGRADVVRNNNIAIGLETPVLTTPAHNAIVNTNAVTVGGTSDPGATVRVYNAGVSLGEVIADGSGIWSGPFSIPDGDHVLTSRVVDAGGQSALSNAVNIHVDAPPAPPSLTTPIEGETLGAGAVLVSGSAQAGSTVKVYEGLTSLGAVTAAANGSWSKSIPFTVKGAHSIVATATDLGGEGAPSVARGFTITTATPVFTSPVNNAATNDGNVTITGTAEGGATVAVSVGGSPLASVVADPSGVWSLPQVLADGDYTYDATSTALDTTVSLPAAPLTITVDTFAPAVPTIDMPAEGVEVNSALAPFSGTGEPNATIVLFRNGVQAATATVTPAGTWTKGVIVSDGAYAFTALARDRAGNDSALTDARNITVVIPVEITTPVADSLNPRTTLVTVVGDASASNARIYEGTKLLANAVMKNGVAKASINFTTGVHTIYARTVSGGSVGAPSPSVTFQVDATPPTVTYANPGSSLPVAPTPIISGTATDAGSVISGVAKVNVEFRNWVNTLEGTGEATCVGCAGPAVTWTMPRPAGVLPGLHKIRIWATDDRGNVSASVYANVLIP